MMKPREILHAAAAGFGLFMAGSTAFLLVEEVSRGRDLLGLAKTFIVLLIGLMLAVGGAAAFRARQPFQQRYLWAAIVLTIIGSMLGMFG